MTAVAIQPSTTMVRLAVKFPITAFLDTSNVITAMSGTATTPLMTALQKSPFMGSMGEYCSTSAASTLVAMRRLKDSLGREARPAEARPAEARGEEARPALSRN